MRLEQLQAFLAVSTTKSFQEAARQCGITQSTVSRQIQALEAELGLSLFHRSTQATLTVAGNRFMRRAQKICQEWAMATAELDELREGKQSELCIAVIHSVCAYYLPPVLQEFSLSYPDVQLRVTSLGSDRALKVLKDGLVDAAIVMNNRFFTARPEFVVDSLFRESINVLMASNHPLADCNPISWADLAQYPQVVFKDGYGMQRLVQEQFQRQDLQFKSVLELNTLDAFRGVVRQGQFIALLPHSALHDVKNDPDFVIRSTVDPSLTREVVLVTTHDRLEIPPIQRFRTLVNNFIGQAGRSPQAEMIVSIS
ncbi:MAG: LysR family transcriptional regulator [Leptolyngbyaceae bacterium]|nr:LysR family transcriptional regulator [Leptolyngbyaceae bacterium]